MPSRWTPNRWEAQRRQGLARFERQVQQGQGCWMWTGNVNPKGYGYLQFMGKPWLAHRFSYVLHKAPIPNGLFVLHRCDTPACVNPDHLFIGTKGDNNRDKQQKGRARGRKRPGELNLQHKLTQRDVEDIRFLYAIRSMTQVELGREFGVSQAQISKIVRNESWVAAPSQ